MTEHQEQLLNLLGKSFRGTLVQDEILEPFFIVRYADGGFGVMKTRIDGKGNLKFRVLGYPSSFTGCLDSIAKEKQHEEGKVYNSIQEYIENWKKISKTITEAYKDWDVNRI